MGGSGTGNGVHDTDTGVIVIGDGLSTCGFLGGLGRRYYRVR